MSGLRGTIVRNPVDCRPTLGEFEYRNQGLSISSTSRDTRKCGKVVVALNDLNLNAPAGLRRRALLLKSVVLFADFRHQIGGCSEGEAAWIRHNDVEI